MHHGTFSEISSVSPQLQLMFSLEPTQKLTTSGSVTLYVLLFFKPLLGSKGKKPLHSSSVVCVRFDPLSGRVVASASTDGICQITTCYKEDTDATLSSGPFGGVTTFGEVLISFTAIGWVNYVSFSPSGNNICYGSNF
jgi:WD40 repeat protein